MLARIAILAAACLILLAPAASADMCQAPPNPNQLSCRTGVTDPTNDVACVETVAGYAEAVAAWAQHHCPPRA